MSNEKECCTNCAYLYEEYGCDLCKKNDEPMEDMDNEKCDDYERMADYDWEGDEWYDGESGN